MEANEKEPYFDGMAEENLITSWEFHEGTACSVADCGRHSLLQLENKSLLNAAFTFEDGCVPSKEVD
ncbi:unnamed protein product [Prunus armeniaca]